MLGRLSSVARFGSSTLNRSVARFGSHSSKSFSTLSVRECDAYNEMLNKRGSTRLTSEELEAGMRPDIKKAASESTYPLTLGAPVLPPPPAAKEAFLDSLNKNWNTFTSYGGGCSPDQEQEIRESVIQIVHQDRPDDAQTLQALPATTVIPSAKQGASYMFELLKRWGYNQVIISQPSYRPTELAAIRQGLKVRPVWNGENSAEESAIQLMKENQNTAVLVISPDNPVSNIPSDKLIRAAIANDVFMLFDDAYWDSKQLLNHKVPSIYPNHPEHMAIIMSGSKGGARLAGNRAGVLFSSERVQDHLKNIVCRDQSLVSGMSAEALETSLDYLKNHPDEYQEHFNELNNNTSVLIDKLSQNPKINATDGMFLTLSVDGVPGESLRKALLDQKIATLSHEAHFGLNDIQKHYKQALPELLTNQIRIGKFGLHDPDSITDIANRILNACKDNHWV